MNEDFQTIFNLLCRYNLTETVSVLKSEAQILGEFPNQLTSNSNVGFSLTDQYSEFYEFINNCLPIHACELRVFLYPVFVHIYIQLISLEQLDQANDFFQMFSLSQEEIYKRDLLSLQDLSLQDGVSHFCLLDIFSSNKFSVRVSRESFEYFQQNFLDNKLMIDLSNIIHEKLRIDLLEQFPRDQEIINRCRGGFIGESTLYESSPQISHGKVTYSNIEELDPIHPNMEHLSLPKLSVEIKKYIPHFDKQVKALPKIRLKRRLFEANCDYIDEISKSGESNSILYNSVMHSVGNLTGSGICAAFNDNCELLAVGTDTGIIHIKCFTEAANDQSISHDYQDNNSYFDLSGHISSVYDLAWSINRDLLISSSSDGSVKSWSTATGDCLMTITNKGPIWSVDLAPTYESYIICGNNDESINLYEPHNPDPIRRFIGDIHGPITCVKFHDNINCIGSGGIDRTVRIFDIRSGVMVRSFTGHKGIINSLNFSPDGKYLMSGCEMGVVNIWDLASSNWLFKTLRTEDFNIKFGGSVMKMAFCRNSEILTVGRQIGQIDVWNYRKLMATNREELKIKKAMVQSSDSVDMDLDEFMLSTMENSSRDELYDNLYTKTLPVKALQFNHQNNLNSCVFYNDM